MKTRSFSRGHPELSFPNLLPAELADSIIYLAGAGTDCSSFRRLRLVNKVFDNLCMRHLYTIVSLSGSAQLERLSVQLRSLPATDRVIRHLFVFRPDSDGYVYCSMNILRFIKDFAAESVVNLGLVTESGYGDYELMTSIFTLKYPSLSSLALSVDFVFGRIDYDKIGTARSQFPNVRSLHLDWRRGATWSGQDLSAIFPSVNHLGLLVSFYGPHITSLMNEVHRIRGAPPDSHIHGPTVLAIPDTVESMWVEADPDVQYMETNVYVCFLRAVSFQGVDPIRQFEYDARSALTELDVGYFRAIWENHIEQN